LKYNEINKSIIYNKDYIEIKDTKLYKYLLDNNVAYYYSKFVSKLTNKYEERIIKSGNNFNRRYVMSIRLLKDISIKTKLPFLLFKTHRYLSEVVDGDIDILVESHNFEKWIDLLRAEGFKCDEEGLRKASCLKKGYCKIEPRVSVAFHNFTIISERKVWKKTEPVTISGVKITKADTNIDICSLLLNTLYGPNYIRLYTFIISKKIDLKKTEKLLTTAVYKDLLLIINEINKPGNLNKRFPFFYKDRFFFSWWVKRILLNNDFKFRHKIKHLVFFYYIKYRFILTNNLYFSHDWKVL